MYQSISISWPVKYSDYLLRGLAEAVQLWYKFTTVMHLICFVKWHKLYSLANKESSRFVSLVTMKEFKLSDSYWDFESVGLALHWGREHVAIY